MHEKLRVQKAKNVIDRQKQQWENIKHKFVPTVDKFQAYNMKRE